MLEGPNSIPNSMCPKHALETGISLEKYTPTGFEWHGLLLPDDPMSGDCHQCRRDRGGNEPKRSLRASNVHLSLSLPQVSYWNGPMIVRHRTLWAETSQRGWCSSDEDSQVYLMVFANQVEMQCRNWVIVPLEQKIWRGILSSLVYSKQSNTSNSDTEAYRTEV